MRKTAGPTTREFAGKKILFIVENLPCPFDRRVWQEACSLRDAGARVSIICPTARGYRKRFEMIDAVAVYRHPLPLEARGNKQYIIEYAIALIWEFLLSLKIFFSRGFDVIHICNPPDLLFLVAAPFKLLGKKLIFDHHDLTPELYTAKFGRKDFFYRLLLSLERRTFKYADVCLATNNSYRDIALSRGGKEAQDVFVVQSGPSLARIRSVDPDPRLRKGRRYLVGYVGVIGRQEGLPYLVDACFYIINEQRRRDVQFACAGGGTDLARVKKYAQERGVADFFYFTGRIPDRELLTLLSTADVCVNTDEYNELNDKSTMNKILEYMALKKAIVQFDLTEGRISAGDAALYAKPNDARDLADKILSLLDKPLLRKRMGMHGYKRIKNRLAWEYQQEKLYAAYKRVFSL